MPKTRGPITHELKTWVEYFQEISFMNGKTFELRKADRDFQVGDYLELREWDNEREVYTGCRKKAWISYILRDAEQFGLRDGFVILSIELVSITHDRKTSYE